MDRRVFLASASSALCVLAGSVLGEGALAQTPILITVENYEPPLSEASIELKRVFEAQFQILLKSSPQLCSNLGLDKGDLAYQKSQLDGASKAAVEQRLQILRDRIVALEALDAKSLSGIDRINYDIVLEDGKRRIKAAEAFDFGARGGSQPYILSQLTGAYQSVPDFLDNRHLINDVKDAHAYLSRLNAFATVLQDETIAFNEDVAKGVLPPNFILTKTLIQMRNLRQTKTADTVLVKSLVRRCLEKQIKGDWCFRATALVDGPIAYALDEQIKAVEDALRLATDTAGVWRLPKGKAYYTHAANAGTTTDISPKEIHDIGLKKVAELSAQIAAAFNQIGMFDGTVGERLHALAKDAKFVYANTDVAKEALLNDLNVYIEAMSKRLPYYFDTLPKSKIEVRRVPKATEVGAPGGYYQSPSIDGTRAGAYYINLRDTAETPLWELPTLTYHEAIPGHHLQRSIQTEAKSLPMLRRISGFTAYTEGWALYSEQLADEMGVYKDDPYGRIGYHKAALFRAVRLVVDTGLHHFKWTREQAIDYMVKIGGDAQTSATTEVERYCVWPGQALAYMTGKIAWLKLREAAVKKMGNGFDIKRFHELGLLSGPMPLAILERVYAEAGMI